MISRHHLACLHHRHYSDGVRVVVLVEVVLEPEKMVVLGHPNKPKALRLVVHEVAEGSNLGAITEGALRAHHSLDETGVHVDRHAVLDGGCTSRTASVMLVKTSTSSSTKAPLFLFLSPDTGALGEKPSALVPPPKSAVGSASSDSCVSTSSAEPRGSDDPMECLPVERP